MAKQSAEKNVEIKLLVQEARYLRNFTNDQKKAIKVCDKILNISPDNRDAMLIKAGALCAIFEMQKSDDLLKQIMQKWPEHWEAYYLYGMNCFGRNKDETALEFLDKSLELDRRFDNVIEKAQMLHLLNKEGYMGYIEEAKKMDKSRAENFMKNHWISSMDDVEPTLTELLNAAKFILKNKLHRGGLRK